MTLVERLRDLGLPQDEPDARDEDRLMWEAADALEQAEARYARLLAENVALVADVARADDDYGGLAEQFKAAWNRAADAEARIVQAERERDRLHALLLAVVAEKDNAETPITNSVVNAVEVTAAEFFTSFDQRSSE